MKTEQQYKVQAEVCAQIFHKKTQEYGDSYKAFRPHALFSQCLNKVQIAKNIQEGVSSNVGESQHDCFTAIYNYSLMYFINQEGKTYSGAQEICFEVMKDKNRLYGDRWKEMWVEDITDFIHVKLQRVESLLSKKNNVSQEYVDVANYAIFALILLSNVSEKA